SSLLLPPPPSSTLLPYTTLFRSQPQVHQGGPAAQMQTASARVALLPEPDGVRMQLDQVGHDLEPPRMHVVDGRPHRRSDHQTFRRSAGGDGHTHEAFLQPSAGPSFPTPAPVTRDVAGPPVCARYSTVTRPTQCVTGEVRGEVVVPG